MAQPWELVVIILMRKCQRPAKERGLFLQFCPDPYEENLVIFLGFTEASRTCYNPIFDSLGKKKWLYP